MKNSFKGFKSEDLPDGSVILPAKLHPSPLKMENISSFETIIRSADYIGSFLVNGQTQKERTDIVYKKLESMRNVTQRKSVLLVISLSGIKVCNETGESVRMAHALRRISYATSDPDFCQFSFLAREPKGQANAQYCHTFITKTPALAEELNDIVGEAFRLAYSKQKQITRGLVTKTPSFNDIIERQLRRHRPPGMEGAIEEVKDEAGVSKDDTNQQEFDGYNLLSGDKTKKIIPENPVKKKATKNIQNSSVAVLKEKIDRSPNESKHSEIIPLHKPTPNDLYNVKHTPKKPLPNPPTTTAFSGTHGFTPRSERNNYDETDDLAAEVSLEQQPGNYDLTPPWMYANRRVKSAFVPKPHKKSAFEPHNSGNPDKEIISPDRPCSGPHANIKLTHSTKLDNHIPDQYKYKEAAPLPPQRMDSLPTYDLAERGFAEGESGVGTGATSLPGKYYPNTDTSTIYMGSTSDSSEKSAGHDAMKDAMKWPEKWYQPDIPREVALDLLSQGQVGSFVVRDSSSHSGCYALSVRISKSDISNSVIHYLIQRTVTGFKLKGLDKEWPTMKSLVTHLTVMPEMLPCTLVLVSPKRHTTTTSNPAFCPIDAPTTANPQSSNFQDPFCSTDADIDDDDLDYQRLSDFSSMMADLCLM